MTETGPIVETIKSMILGFQNAERDTSVLQRLRFDTVPGKATVCISSRRRGKSTYLFQIVAGLLEQCFLRQKILFPSFFDDWLHDLQHGDLGMITEAYFFIFPDKKDVETV